MMNEFNLYLVVGNIKYVLISDVNTIYDISSQLCFRTQSQSINCIEY
jgi:hypothetical protein